MDFRGKRATVMGLGLFGGGVGVARFLLRQGAKVTVTDLDSAEKLAPSVEAVGPDATYHLGGHPRQDFTDADVLVVNPAVKPDSEYVRLAEQHGVQITTEMNLFFERCPVEIVGVTGSVGKTTTTAMIGRALEAVAARPGSRRAWVGGNIGRSLLEDMDAMSPGDVVVLELSSAQLYRLGPTGRAPGIAVVTNISENHIDWHGTFENYVAAKRNIVANPGSRAAVLNYEDKVLRRWASGHAGGRTVFFSVQRELDRGVSLVGGWIVARGRRGEEGVVEAGRMRLPGAHNLANAAAAVAGCLSLIEEEWHDIGPGALREAGRALEGFEGAEHRLEFVAEVGGVRYYNDSKATTPVSALAALASFDAGRVVLILGGRNKGLSYGDLADAAAGCRGVVLIGEMADRLEDLLLARNAARSRVRAGSMQEAVRAGAGLAQPGDVVLLSPACTSYDWYKNYEERGRAFKDAVRRLGEGRGAARC